LKQYVDRLNGEHARRSSVFAFAAEAFMDKVGYTHVLNRGGSGVASPADRL